MDVLFETDQLILEYEYESVRLRKKSTEDILMVDFFYGDPFCGLIDPHNQWAIVAGEHLTIWTPKQLKNIRHEGLKWVHDLRVKDPETVEMLIDPWSDASSVWEINIHTFEAKRIKAFKDYREKAYTEHIIW